MTQRNAPGRSCSFRRLASVLALVAGACVSSNALADGVINPGGEQPVTNPALEQLLVTYPGLQTTQWNNRIMSIAGVPMNTAERSDLAAAAFLTQHIEAFGAGADVELELSRINDISSGGKTIFAYDQWMDNMPVEFGAVRVLVLNTIENGQPTHKVTFAGAKLAAKPAAGFAPMKLTTAEAMKVVREVPRFSALDTWSEPQLVVYFGEGDFQNWIEPTRAYKFVGEHADPAKASKWTFFVDASTGELLHARTEILHVDITGQVQGFSSPNNDADRVGNPPVLTNVPEIQVRVQGSPASSVFTDANGNFTIPWTGSTAVTLEVGVVNGRRVTVADQLNPEILVTQSVTPGTPALIQLNTVPAEGPTAQMNAFIHQTITRNFFRDRAPTFTAIDPILPANVMYDDPASPTVDSCNAFYNGASTNFFRAGGGCNNTAIPSVVAHEYGHHIVNRLGLAQGAFGEGFSDTMGLLIYNDPVVGRGFTTTGGVIRNPDTANRQYPCSSPAIHTCGLIIGGVTWDIRTGFITRDGSVAGLNAARQLHVDWAQATLGGQGLDSAHPTTAVEYLTVDDNDGILCNGTPNYSIIRTGFLNHGITSPGAESRAIFSLVSTVPAFITSDQNLVLDFDITPGTATFGTSDVSAVYRFQATDTYTSAPMQNIGGNRYRATLNGYQCLDTVELNVRVASSAGLVVYPFGCDRTGPITVPVIDDFVSTSDTFEVANAAWVVGPDTATAGNWTRGNPIGTTAQPENDNTPGAGVNCWFTGQGPVGSTNAGAADIDGGSTILTSAPYDIAGAVPADVRISYSRWYSNGEGSTPHTDTFLIEGRINAGPWQTLELIGPGNASDPNTNPGWVAASYTMAEKGLPAGNTLQLRFTASDLADGSLVEAAIDDLLIFQAICNPTGCDSIDFNGDGLFPDDADLVDFLSVLAGGACSTNNCNDIDYNNDGLFPDDSDLVAFLRVLAGGDC